MHAAPTARHAAPTARHAALAATPAHLPTGPDAPPPAPRCVDTAWLDVREIEAWFQAQARAAASGTPRARWRRLAARWQLGPVAETGR